MNVSVQQMLVLDSLGALLSSVILGLVLPYFQVWIGMPLENLYFLATIAVFLMAFSFLSSRLIEGERQRFLLATVASLNFGYCCFTGYLLVDKFSTLTQIGAFYFISEILVILAIVALEFRVLALTK